MTVLSKLEDATASFARRAAGAVLGLGLVGAVALSAPMTALAQAPNIAAIPQATGAGPALWVVSDADSTIYLFGTVHVLKPETGWSSPRLEAAFDSASQVWFEIENPDDQAAIVPLIQQHGLSPDRPLSSLLSTNELNLLGLASSTIGLSAVQMDPFRPWLAGLTLAVAPLVEAGYDPESGVELVLRARAVANGQTTHGLETIDQQVRILAGFPEAAQLAFLRQALEGFEDAPVELDQLVEGWAAGDVEAIKRLGVDEMKAEPQLYQALLVDRNRDWAGQIQTMLAGSGVTFIAVGAAHLAGEDSVQAILAERGATVARVQP